MSDFLGKGTSAEFFVKDQEIKMVEDEELISESIKIILSTNKGERVMQPDFGADINHLAFSENSVSTSTMIANKVQSALETWEPRIEVLDVTVESDQEGDSTLYISIDYLILSRNIERNLVYPFFLQGAS